MFCSKTYRVSVWLRFVSKGLEKPRLRSSDNRKITSRHPLCQINYSNTIDAQYDFVCYEDAVETTPAPQTRTRLANYFIAQDSKGPCERNMNQKRHTSVTNVKLVKPNHWNDETTYWNIIHHSMKPQPYCLEHKHIYLYLFRKSLDRHIIQHICFGTKHLWNGWNYGTISQGWAMVKRSYVTRPKVHEEQMHGT